MENEIKFNLRQRLQTGSKNVLSMKHLAAILFYMSFIYCITASNLLISTFVKKKDDYLSLPMLFL